ncbi:hypothetical protein Tco_0527911 [Tanacetum coccineum]
MSKVLQERGFGSLPSSTEANPRDQNRTLIYETRQMTILFPSRLNGYCCEENKGSYGPQFSEAYSEASHINYSIPRKEKDTGSFTLHCFINNICFDNALVDLGASVSVMLLSTYLNLGLGELAHTKLTVELANKTVKYPKGTAKNVLVGIGKFVFPIDFIILDMPEDIKVPLILGRPFLSTSRAKIDVFKRKITLRIDVCKQSLDPLDGDYIELNDLNKQLELRRDQGALMNVPIFVGTFSVVTDFVVLEDMDAYRDEEMGDVIVGEPFLKEIVIKARRFEGMITIYNGNDEVTYQMVRSHSRFKHYTNEQCNKIPPLLKVSEEDKMNEISHAYQKLKGFYKGVLNLGPDYIRDEKTEE